jgi:hypothetical protein
MSIFNFEWCIKFIIHLRITRLRPTYKEISVVDGAKLRIYAAEVYYAAIALRHLLVVLKSGFEQFLYEWSSEKFLNYFHYK